MSAERFHSRTRNSSAVMRNGNGREWKGMEWKGMDSWGQLQIQTTSYVTRETATLGLGGNR